MADFPAPSNPAPSNPAPSIGALLELERHGPDTYVGISASYPWKRVYGGQVVAQALRAACDTVSPEMGVHSLHAYFMRAGDEDEPIRYEVDQLRTGRSFATRQVVARQSNGAIMNLSASFHVHEDQVDLQVAMPRPGLGSPETARDEGTWSPLFDRRCPVPGVPGRVHAWMRIRENLPDDPALHACALAYLSDETPMSASLALHPARRPDGIANFVEASLDHSVWFHRPVRADVWQLHEFESVGMAGARGLSLGRIFDTTGVHVATVAQEVLLRVRN